VEAYVEYPCACRGIVLVRIGPEATCRPKPYVFSVTCEIRDGWAIPVGVYRPEGGFKITYLTAGSRALRAEGLKVKWDRVLDDQTIRQIVSDRC
jgi:hypothetical protein